AADPAGHALVGRPRSLVGYADVVPEAAVEVEVVTVGLAGATVADVGVEGVAVVGGLQAAAGALDRDEIAGDVGAGSGAAGERRPVDGARAEAPGTGRGVRDEPVEGEAVGGGEDVDAIDLDGLQGGPDVGRGHG